MKKRVLSFLMVILLAAAVMSPALAASDKTPTGIVPGYSLSLIHI